MEEVKQMKVLHTQQNVCAKKALQAYIGELNHISGIIEFLRPFMADLYVVLHGTNNTRAPANCHWTKQWQHVTDWMMGFFKNEASDLSENAESAPTSERASGWTLSPMLHLGASEATW